VPPILNVEYNLLMPPIKNLADTLPTITETIKSFGLETKKSLGQHFLTDANLLDKIVRYAGNLTDKTVLEIGPGPGGLTRSILASKAKKVIAIEKDKRCIDALNMLKNYEGKRLEIIEADALTINLNDITDNNRICLISNLPYNISTQLLINWLDQIENIESMTLMFQKEVASRIIAPPGSKTYGRLSVLCQWLCKTEKLFDISPKAFTPPPKVVSTIVSLLPYEKPLYEARRESLEKLCKAAFGQRRKTLRTSLKQISKSPEDLLKRAGIDPSLRPEVLDIAQFCTLSRELDAE